MLSVTSGPSFRNSCFAKQHRSSVPFAGPYRVQLARLQQTRVRSQSYCLALSHSTGTGPSAVVERYRWVGWVDVSRNRADIVTVLCVVTPTRLIRQPSPKLRTHTGAFMQLPRCILNPSRERLVQRLTEICIHEEFKSTLNSGNTCYIVILLHLV